MLGKSFWPFRLYTIWPECRCGEWGKKLLTSQTIYYVVVAWMSWSIPLNIAIDWKENTNPNGDHLVTLCKLQTGHTRDVNFEHICKVFFSFLFFFLFFPILWATWYCACLPSSPTSFHLLTLSQIDFRYFQNESYMIVLKISFWWLTKHYH